MHGYSALYATACSRILMEWDLTARQQDLCLLLSSLTYGADMLTLAFTRQQDLAEALGWDAPSLSRVLKSVIALGLVKLEVCAGEKLLSLQLFTEQVKSRITTAMQAARDRLRQMQQRRDSGRCDADGQMRLPEILPSESEAPRADAMAFRAMMEADMAQPPSARAHGPLTDPARSPAPTSTDAPRTPALIRELQADIARIPNSAPQLTQFRQYLPWWRKQASLYPARLAAAIAAHRERPVPAKTPGGWIKTAMERLADPAQTLLPL